MYLILIAFLLSLFHFSSFEITLGLINIALLSYLFISARQQQKTWQNNKFIITALAAFVLWYALSLSWSTAVTATQASLSSITLILFAALSAATLPRSQWRNLQQIIIAAGLLLFAVVLFQIFLLNEARPEGLFLSPNNLGGFLNLLLLPVIAFFLYASGDRQKHYYGLLIGLFTAILIITQSRGALLAALIAGVILTLLSSPWRKQSPLYAIAWIAIGAVGGSLISIGSIDERLLATASSLSQASEDINLINPRVGIWAASLEMVREYPLLGWGGGTFMQAFPAFRPPEYPPDVYNTHNDYLQVLVELGPIGLLLLLLIVTGVTLRGIRLSRMNEEASAEKVGLAASLGALFIQMFFTSSLYATPIALLAGLYMGRLTITTSPTSSHGAVETRHTALIFRSVVVLSIFHFISLLLTQSYLNNAAGKALPAERFELYQNAARWNPLSDVPHLQTAALVHDLLQKGEIEPGQVLDETLGYLDRAQQLMPLRRQTYHLRAQLLQYQLIAPIAEIETNFLRTLELNPKFLRARIDYANWLDSLKRHGDACDVLLEGLPEYYYTYRTTLIEYIDSLQKCQQEQHIHAIHAITSPELSQQRSVLQEYSADIIHYKLTRK